MTITLKIDTEPVRQLMQVAPAQVLSAIGRFTNGAFIEHRLAWLKLKGNRFGRGGRGIEVLRVGQNWNQPPKPKQVVYSVPPRAKPTTQTQAAKLLQDFRAAIFTGNFILPIHEEGRDIRSAKWMAVPVRRVRGASTPSKFRDKFPKRQLVTFKSKLRPGELVLREQMKAKKGQPAKFVTRWRLTKFVDMQPTLQFYATWERQNDMREKRWSDAVDKLMASLLASPIRKGVQT